MARRSIDGGDGSRDAARRERPGLHDGALGDAESRAQELGETRAGRPGAWLIDRKESPLARDLRVQTMPAFILVSNEGRILFNGDPTDDGLWDALTKLDPKIIRPASPGGTE